MSLNSEQALERHYTVAEIAELWHVDESTIRRIFQDEPGVLRVGTRLRSNRGQRSYISIRIPASVVERVYGNRTR